VQHVDIVRESTVRATDRVRQLSSMFDVPISARSSLTWSGEVRYDERPWNVGCIVGPSGSGKSTVASELFGLPRPLDWGDGAVVDAFDVGLSIDEIATACSSVGFNTIPAWCRPFDVLSTGEKFRAELARRLIETDGIIVVDEFTSVVDRQVAKVGAYAVQKHVRKADRQFVAVSCHYDIIDWLQPDWILEPVTMRFAWRSVQPRPGIEAYVARAEYSSWAVFAPFHYLTATLNRSARCFVLVVDETPVSFCAVLYRPHPRTRNIYGFSRVVTLPDWQGVGLAYALTDRVASYFKTLGYRIHSYPSHPAYIRGRDRSPNWAMIRAPANFVTKGRTSSISVKHDRPCATFAYVGQDGDEAEAIRLLDLRPFKRRRRKAGGRKPEQNNRGSA